MSRGLGDVYKRQDIEDAHKLKILSFEETSCLLLGFFDDATKERILKRIDDEHIDDNNEKVVYMRACAIGMLEHECAAAFVRHEDVILAGTFKGSLIDHVPAIQHKAYDICTQLSKKKIYCSKPVLDIELSGYKIMDTLLTHMVEAVMSPERYYSQQLIGRVSSQYDIDSTKLETRIMAVLDYISGMTDVYALDIYQKIAGISLPIV